MNIPPQPPPPPGYGPPPYGGPYYQAPQTNGLAVASMILGILGLAGVPVIGAILALVFGYSSRDSIDASGGREGGRGMASAGIVLGWVGIFWGIIYIALMVTFFVHFAHDAHDWFRILPTPSG